jgi:biopolymer transport protein ExbD
MAFKHDNDDDILAQINIIPLVDVSLVLLIIFIITINHILTPSLSIKLPQARSAENYSTAQSLDVSVTGEGVLYLGNDVVTLKELKERLKKQHDADADTNVVVNIDKSVHFQRIVDILDIIEALGISKLDIRTAKD